MVKEPHVEEEEFSDVEVKGRLDAKWRLERQLDRCNSLAIEAALDPRKEEAFKRAVEVLLGDLPISIRQKVMDRRNEFIIPPREEWQYRYCAGQPMGTPDNPVLDADGRVISPILVTVPEELDPYALLEIIKEELERANLSWEYILQHEPLRKIEKKLPEGIVSRAEKMLVDYIMQVRAEHPDLRIGWKQLLGELLQRTPALPVLKPEEEEKEDE